jgi:hypothetical protein
LGEEVTVPDPLLDDIDRIFARAGAVEPSPDLFSRVLAQTRPVPQMRSLLLYLATYLLTLAGLALFAYELGTAAVRSGATTLIAALAGDLTLLLDAPAAYLGALTASIPWTQTAGVLIDLVILAIVTRLLRGEATTKDSGRRTGLEA